MTLEEILVGDWNVYVAQTQWVHTMLASGKFIGARKTTPKNVKLLRDMIAWCREQRVEPRLWVYFLFKSRKWGWPPKFDAGSLMSPTALKRYRGTKMQGLGFFQRRLRASAQERAEVQAYDPNRDTTPGVEALKTRYEQEGAVMRCMAEAVLRTLGYHPRSAVCVRCPVQGECAVRLEALAPFSLLALRAGRLTQDEAMALARTP